MPHVWRTSLRWSRALLGLAAVAAFAWSTSFNRSPWLVILTAYAAYSLLAALVRNLEDRGYSNVALMLDSLYFLLWASISWTPATFWVTLAIYVSTTLFAVVMHDWDVVGTFFLVSFLWVLLLQPPQATQLIPVIACGGLVAIVYVLQKSYLNERLWIAARQSVLYRYDAQVSKESERERIAHDFHDGPLQSFIGFQMRLEIIRKLMKRDIEAAGRELEQLQVLCKMQVNELRAFVRAMRPPEEGLSFTASINRLVEQFQRDTGVITTFTAGNLTQDPETDISLELLHVVRESLNNVQKHSKATEVSVSVEKVENLLEIAVEDNGGGFPFSGTYTLDELELLRLGPVSIKRRIRLLNGDLTVESKPGEGASLRIRVPA